MKKMPDAEKDMEDPVPKPSEGELHQVYTYDDVFGEISDQGPNYRNVGVIGTTALMMKSMLGLGVLSIPSAFDTLGIVPGVVCLLVVATITSWSGYIVGTFKLRHREVYGIDDAGGLMWGKFGRNVVAGVFLLYWVFVAGSGMLSLSIALNTVSSHATCTAVFVAVAAVIGLMVSSIRTLGQITWLAWIGVIGIVASFIIVTVAVGVQDRPVTAPQDGPWVSDYKIAASPPFSEAITAVSQIVFAYAGTPAFFSIVSEMRDPRLYPRALVACQGGVTALYLVIGIVIYYYCGSYVASPALGSAGMTMRKVCYGFAIPGLIVSTGLVTHLPAKYIFLRILRGSRHLTSNSMVHWCTWLGCTFGITIIAYIIASAIPVFNDLVSLVGALLGTFMCFQPMGCMWLYDHWSDGKADRRPRWIAMVCWSIFVVLAGTFLTIAGTYGSVLSIISSYNQSGGSSAWSCADNSDS